MSVRSSSIAGPADLSFKPWRSSSMEIVPELSVSKLLKSSLKPATSSAVMVRAIAIKPILLNLEIPAKFLNRLNTTLSSFVFGATFGSATHGCFNT